MKGERKYIFILITVTILYFIVELASPKEFDWNITYHIKDKNPYGSYLIGERLPDLFTNVDHSYFTIYEMADSLTGNLFILSQKFMPSEEDAKSLLDFVSKGNNAFIAAGTIGNSNFLDTLGIEVKNLLFDQNLMDGIALKDTLFLNFTNEKINQNSYPVQRSLIYNYFEPNDQATVICTIDQDKPVVIQKKIGEGCIYLCSTPIAFTNNYLLLENNNEFISKALSYLPDDKLHWTEYYQSGRLEARTPLRYILSNDSLSIAYYVIITSLILFIAFEAKRRQRIIPIITPLTNSTLEFVSTLGNLYYQNSNHKNIAEKRILFFLEKLRSNYYLKNTDWSEEFMIEIAHKTENDLDATKSLFALISKIKNSAAISENTLKDLSTRLDNFKFN